MSVQQRLKRTRRICSVEENRLNALIGKRNQIDTQIQSCVEQIKQLIRQRDHETMLASRHPSLEQLTQTHVWIEGLDESIQQQQSHKQELQQQRDELQSEVLGQRTRVRGLEILVDQLQLAVKTEQQAEQFTLADENAIRDFAEG
ncbi:flagellar FliJ family protein [Roseiconus lacunae]|uniref:Flagellar FliJ family protein n=1 Tax=Roseiconus lacunae TaxID=2605694 RepID=A0ABT7PDE2_9BACT|nr:flagellar FliJ family protein [Roseiconus lacunae]MCD0459814.1 flagellar FliJ family protein [Roseiconus lacunae]MDM4014512.1 flagellar FliJ family protein [Roseiconus lacunae]WRQ49825.1 flagellar FliJ family protein [Stieleria sp. HD01]